eukprot:s615_g22.t1
MASTRYGKIAEDVELGARPRNVQAREVKWSAPDGEDDSHRQDKDKGGGPSDLQKRVPHICLNSPPQDLQSQLLTQLRRLSTTQKAT